MRHFVFIMNEKKNESKTRMDREQTMSHWEYGLPYLVLFLFSVEEYIGMLLIVMIIAPLMDFLFYVPHDPTCRGLGRLLFNPLVMNAIYRSEKTPLSMMASSILLVQMRGAAHDFDEPLSIMISRVFLFLILIAKGRWREEGWWYLGASALGWLLDSTLHRRDDVSYEERGLCEYLLYEPAHADWKSEQRKKKSPMARPWMMLW